MIFSVRNRPLLLVAALATLALRALTPDGYMPGAANSGLLYELCPDGMPAEIMEALAGAGHHHHHDSDDAAAVTGTEQCPIGHMLASAVAADSGSSTEALPDSPEYEEVSVAILFRAPGTVYRSRAPPA